MAAVKIRKATAVAVLLAAAAVVLMAGSASAALACGSVDSKLSPCIPYVTEKAADVSKACCAGVNQVNSMARTTPDRQAACRCLKSLAGTVKALKMSRVALVPGKCHVSVPFPISMSTDCNKIH